MSTTWVIVIIVVALAMIIGNITLLLRSNKDFDFPDNYEKKPTTDDDDDEPKGLI